jgi:folate-binding protein YgfZ
VRRVDITGADAFLLSVSSESSGALKRALQDAGCVECTPAALDAARIEQGFPLFGRDISDQNLPQEVHRDALAISFVKGCYLGQETVARIDALGHVNKLLVGLRGHGPSVPEPGSEIFADGQPVGRVTSATYSPKLGAPLVLGYVKRGKESLGTRLSNAAGELEVIALPLV